MSTIFSKKLSQKRHPEREKGVLKKLPVLEKKHLGAFGTTSLYLKAQPVYT